MEQVIDLQRLALRRTAPRKAQKVLHDFLCPLRLLQDYLQVFARALGNLRIFHQQVRESHDRGERIVYLVRHAGDELAHGSHLFCVHQFGLDHSGVGDVSHQDHDAGHVTAFIAHGAQVDGEFSVRAIASHDHDFKIVHLHSLQTGLKRLVKFFGVGRRDNAIEPVPDQGLPGCIRDHNHGLGIVQDLAGEVALALQLRLEVFDLRDVQEHAPVLQDPALRIAHDKRILQRVNQAAITAAQRDLKIADGAILL